MRREEQNERRAYDDGRLAGRANKDVDARRYARQYVMSRRRRMALEASLNELTGVMAELTKLGVELQVNQAVVDLGGVLARAAALHANMTGRMQDLSEAHMHHEQSMEARNMVLDDLAPEADDPAAANDDDEVERLALGWLPELPDVPAGRPPGAGVVRRVVPAEPKS